MADFNDIVTIEPEEGGVRATRIQKGLTKARTAGTQKAAQKALESIESEIEVLKKRTRNAAQRALLEQYYEVKSVQTALGEAKMIQLLGAEDEEVQFKAAKELRGGGGQIKVDKGVFFGPNSSPVEDPEITRLKEVESGN